jgi:hypothetical protein
MVGGPTTKSNQATPTTSPAPTGVQNDSDAERSGPHIAGRCPHAYVPIWAAQRRERVNVRSAVLCSFAGALNGRVGAVALA